MIRGGVRFLRLRVLRRLLRRGVLRVLVLRPRRGLRLNAVLKRLTVIEALGRRGRNHAGHDRADDFARIVECTLAVGQVVNDTSADRHDPVGHCLGDQRGIRTQVVSDPCAQTTTHGRDQQTLEILERRLAVEEVTQDTAAEADTGIGQHLPDQRRSLQRLAYTRAEATGQGIDEQRLRIEDLAPLNIERRLAADDIGDHLVGYASDDARADTDDRAGDNRRRHRAQAERRHQETGEERSQGRRRHRDDHGHDDDSDNDNNRFPVVLEPVPGRRQEARDGIPGFVQE